VAKPHWCIKLDERTQFIVSSFHAHKDDMVEERCELFEKVETLWKHCVVHPLRQRRREYIFAKTSKRGRLEVKYHVRMHSKTYTLAQSFSGIGACIDCKQGTSRHVRSQYSQKDLIQSLDKSFSTCHRPRRIERN
jgi:hypothetical protein